jgi:hypothetical protein
MSIFVFTIATATMVLGSFWISSLQNTFVEETDKPKATASKVVVADKKKLPSLVSNLKANIKDFGDLFTDLYSSSSKESNDKKNMSTNNPRTIKPVRLPVDKQ